MRDASELIAAFPKNAVTEIQVRLKEFNGFRFCDVRVVWLKGPGKALSEPRPTKKGISFNPQKMPDLIRALEMACLLEGVTLPPERAKLPDSEAAA